MTNLLLEKKIVLFNKVLKKEDMYLKLIILITVLRLNLNFVYHGYFYLILTAFTHCYQKTKNKINVIEALKTWL